MIPEPGRMFSYHLHIHNCILNSFHKAALVMKSLHSNRTGIHTLDFSHSPTLPALGVVSLQTFLR